jgi:hypothetical protein
MVLHRQLGLHMDTFAADTVRTCEIAQLHVMEHPNCRDAAWALLNYLRLRMPTIAGA